MCKRHHVFVRYIDRESGEYLSNDVGRCDREIKCGYHYTPGEYFQDNPQRVNLDNPFTLPTQRIKKKEATEVITTIPRELYDGCLKNRNQNSLFRYLAKVLDDIDAASMVFERYLVGTSKHWLGATVFPQIDISGNIRQLKIMDYNPATGKRKKSQDESWKWCRKQKDWKKDVNNNDKIFFAGKAIMGYPQNASFQQCFFGEHLLREKEKVVAIVESEKTAMIASVYIPNYLWLATGGVNGCRWTDEKVYQVLCDRQLVFVPDLNAYEKWAVKASVISKTAQSIRLFDLLERKATAEEKTAGLDLADYLVRFKLSEFQNAQTQI